MNAEQAADLSPMALPPFGDPLPYTVVVIDDAGTAHLIDLATGTSVDRHLAVGALTNETLTDVEGGVRGPVRATGVVVGATTSSTSRIRSHA